MSLLPTFRFGAIDLTEYPYSVAFGSDRGGPEAVVATVVSALRDGSLTQVTRYENRTVTMSVLVEGADLADLAYHEAALVAEAMKDRNEFVFNPGDGFAADSVYDTFTADLMPEYDDNLEINGMRRFTLTFAAHPWPRSADKVITPAITAAGPTVLADGSSTTGWSSSNGTVTSSGGAVVSTYDPRVVTVFGGSGTNLVRSIPIDVSTDKYIAVDWKSSIYSYYACRVDGDVENFPEVRREPTAAGFTRSWFKVPDGARSLATLYFDVLHVLNTVASATLSIDQVLLANALPSAGSARQKMSTVYPGGSVPADGDILVEHPTSALGRTLIYTHPIQSGYSPPLRPWRTSGGTVNPAASMVSGAYDDLTAPMVFSIPVDALPKGAAHLWVKLGASSTSAIRLNWSVTSWQGGVAQVGGRQSGNVLVQVPSVGPHFVFPIARMTLPPSRVSGANGFVVIILERDSSSSAIDVTVDEVWAFAMEKGTLTVVDAGDGAVSSGLNANRLRISAPSIDSENGDLRVATAADWSDAWEPAATNILCDQRNHNFNPGGSMIFTVTQAAPDAAVSFEHYPRWHSNAGS